MRQIELLAPAGDFDSLKAAIASGANAIYLAGQMFGARAYAANFSREELAEAIAYAHLRNVKIYVTVNTLYRDDEIQDVIAFIDYLYDIQADALIVQDIGMVRLIQERYDDFDIHLSTQMSLSSYADITYFENQNVQRVVLARENTIEEVSAICAHTDMEIEVFVHGALCVAYSGQCLMSSMIGGRSGNRGACAQPCRLTYHLQEDGRLLNNGTSFLLSPKDLCTIARIGELIDAGVTSFKIEGRMKKPEYVAVVTQAYRKAIDHHLHPETEGYSEDDLRKMKLMFNRSFTSGYLFHDDVLDAKYSGHRGIQIGHAVKYIHKRKQVLVKLTGELRQGDSIVFEAVDKGRPVNKMYKNNQLINTGMPGDLITIEFDYPVSTGAVNKTVDAELIAQVQRDLQKSRKYRHLKFTMTAKKNDHLVLKGTSGDVEVTYASSDELSAAKNVPIDQSRIKKQLLKLGDTIYDCDDVELHVEEDVFIPVALINEARRVVTAGLDDRFSHGKIHHGDRREVTVLDEKKAMSSDFYVVVSDVSQIIPALALTDHIYMRYRPDLASYLQICHAYDLTPALYIPRMQTDQSLQELLKNPCLKTCQKFIVNDYGVLMALKDRDCILGQGFNIYNAYSAASFIYPKVASVECSRKQLQKMSRYDNTLLMQIYGYVENMMTAHCVISQHYFGKKKAHCGKCKGHTYTLVDRMHVAFPVVTDDLCKNHIYHNVPLYDAHYNEIPMSYLVDFTIETPEMVSEICNCILKNNPISFPTTKAYYRH